MHAHKFPPKESATIYKFPAKDNIPSIDAYNRGRSESIHLYTLNQAIKREINDLRNKHRELHEMFVSRGETAASFEEGGNGMEDLKRQVNEIDKKIAVIEERTKKLDDLPTAMEIKQIVSDVIDSKNLATVDKVELEITKSRNIQLIWTIGTIITVTGLAVAIIKLLP